MPSFVPVPRLLPALVLGVSLLTACEKHDSASLVAGARTMVAAGDYKTAMIQLKNAVAEDDKNAEARFELGKLYFEQNDLASAEKEFRRAREAGYAQDDVNQMIARALLGQAEFQRVLDELPAADAGAKGATLQALRATASLGLARKEDARKTLQQAQQRAPGNADVQLALAQLALADGDTDQAMQALDEAIRLDPRHRESLLLKGDLLRVIGKPDEAAATYREVLRIDPRHSNARLALASISIADNALADARREVDAVLKIMPNSLHARYTQALIDFREKKPEIARDHLAAVLKTAPNYLPALLLGGSIEYALGNLQTAETHLNKVLQVAPSNIHAVRLLAASQLRLGRPDDAARTLAPALKSATPDAGVLVVAGEIAQARKDFALATSYFEQAAEQNPDNAAIRTELGLSRLAQGDARAMADLRAAAAMDSEGSRADTLIILNQLKQKQYDAALASIAALEKKQAADPLTWNYRGAAYLGQEDAARARESFGQALKLDPTFFPAAANLALLDIRDKQPAAARQRFESILKIDPKHLNAMLAMADFSQREKDKKAYVGWLEKALNAHPQALQPRLALAHHFLAEGDKNKALSMAREAVGAHPENPAALDLLGTIQLASGDSNNALGSFRKLAERMPGQATPLIKIAAAQIAAKDFASARKSLQDALRVQPDSVDAQLMLGGVEIQGGRFDAAQKLAGQVQQQMPSSAAGFVLEGDAALARKDYPAALAAFERAHKLAPSGALMVRQLQALQADERVEEGEKRLTTWLASHPDDIGVRTALADSQIHRKQYAAAAANYLELNKRSPGSPLVLNNLAWALHESGDARAASFAEQALKLQPENPAVLDTYGWILANSGHVEKGLQQLRKANVAAPDSADIQWHLAYALYLSGDHKRALRELESVLATGSRFSGMDAAHALRTQLSKR